MGFFIIFPLFSQIQQNKKRRPDRLQRPNDGRHGVLLLPGGKSFAAVFIVFCILSKMGRAVKSSNFCTCVAGDVTADVDCHGQTRNMRGCGFNIDRERGGLAAEALRPDAQGVDAL